MTIKIISIIQHFYKDVYIYKPFMSRPSNSEKYIIAKNFNQIIKNLKNNIQAITLKFNKIQILFFVITFSLIYIGSDYFFDIILILKYLMN